MALFAVLDGHGRYGRHVPAGTVGAVAIKCTAHRRRGQVPQKDPGRPALTTNIAKVQAPQGGETPVPSAPQLGTFSSGYGLGYRCLEHYGPEKHMLDFPEGGL